MLITFGKSGNAADYQAQGWSTPEPGYTWSIGTHSELITELPADWPQDRDTIVQCVLHPHMAGSTTPVPFRLAVNGHTLGEEHLTGWSTLAYRLPSGAARPAGRLTIQLEAPHACPPPATPGQASDTRILGMMLRSVAITSAPKLPRADLTPGHPIPMPPDDAAIDRMLQQRIGLTRAELGSKFESLGQSCEFGLVQEHLGIDKSTAASIGLLRFAGIDMADLVRGLHHQFDRIGDHIDVDVQHGEDGPSDLLLREKTYNITMHSFEAAHAADPDRIRREAPASLRMRRRMLLERMEHGERIFVFLRGGEMSPAMILPLLLAVRSVGNAPLLYVDQAADMPNGSVMQMEHGVFHGKLDRLAPASEAGLSDVAGWISILANTYELARKQCLLF